MKLTVIVENKAMNALVRRAHGLSLYLETGTHTVLFDFGPRGELLLSNAAALGLDLKKVDIAVLSHGHNDHSGGLEAFLEWNKTAKVYIHRRAFVPHFARAGESWNNISADPALPERYAGRIVWTEGVYAIDSTLTLFSEVPERVPMFSTNRTLFEQGEDSDYVPDQFSHEQSLLVQDGETLSLLGGCAHRGITNILSRAIEVAGRTPDAVFAGFHTTNPGLGVDEDTGVILRAGDTLRRWKCLYYTGHCTGDGPYALLQTVLGDSMAYLGCGNSYHVD